ncbi:hypothetical protein AXI76_gp213 [Pseudoalteromonas phage H101]|uniref:Uncharacterized protein n=1 Tax=Pseudoalteromonas phage H101 TaxID=1654919 RepID=A0A0H4INE6_9CAUD|nr:hypothetical protein AXI76_gp213 [Pseudoalteromonas phage H101]AKO61114.1 hypothetical protein [Pseudoalteromonas phage H101]
MIDMKCGCGRQARYYMKDKEGSCNKYQRCKTYEELLDDNKRLVESITLYGKTMNQIDDYFEYRNESVQDRKKVHQLLGNLTDKLKEISND